MKYLAIFILPVFIFSKNICDLPKEISKISSEVKITNVSDLKRNDLNGLCVSQIEFKDKDVLWSFLFLWNLNNPKGPSFYLPHDDEDTAFDVATYTIKKYGGSMLSVSSKKGTRNFKGIDPNRNFKKNTYSKKVFSILDTFKSNEFPYLSIHNNKKGFFGNGGEGTVSMHHKSKGVFNFPIDKEDDIGLSGQDNLIYFVGDKVNIDKVRLINSFGMNVKYEILKSGKSDYSMSNYVFYNLKSEEYLNLESELGKLKIQIKMIDQLFLII